MCVSGLVRSIQLVIDLNVKVTLVLCVWLVREISCNTLAFLDRENFAKVEDRLLPMSIFGMRARREPNRFVTGSKVNVKPGNERVDKVISLATEVEGGGKGEFGGRDGIEINCEDRTWISH